MVNIIDMNLNDKLNSIYNYIFIDIKKIENKKFIKIFNMQIKKFNTFYYNDYDKKHAKDLLNKVYEKLIEKNVKNLNISKSKYLITYDYKKTKININITSINKGELSYVIIRQ